LSQPSDNVLVRAAVAGDRAAYGMLYDRYAPLIRAVCYDHTRNLADAQDLAQDVFLRAYERLDQLRRPDRCGRWLVTIARHRCLEWRRQAARDRRRHDSLQETPVQEACAPAENDGELARLGSLLARLPETERLALHAFYLQDRSVDDARQTLGLSRAGFYRAMQRAKKRLRRQLSHEQENIR
jgi:RNA polymerase sigma-70 factor (ECF subfamily)